MPLYENLKSFVVASGGVRFKPQEEKAVKRIIPIKGTLNYDNLQVDKEFFFGLEIIGGTSKAIATVQLFDDELLYLTDIKDGIGGPFQNDEQIQAVSDNAYIADVDGTTDYFLSEINPAPYPKSGLVKYDPVTLNGVDTETVIIDNRTLIIEFMRIADTNVTIFLDSISNTPGLLLKPGEYQSMDIKPYSVDTLYLVSTAPGSIGVRQLHE